jgi:hypothetical protein
MECFFEDQKILQDLCIIKKLIGVGGYGRLYLVTHRRFGDVCAKIIKGSDYDPREFDNLEKFVGSSCENIVRIFGFVWILFIYLKGATTKYNNQSCNTFYRICEFCLFVYF